MDKNKDNNKSSSSKKKAKNIMKTRPLRVSENKDENQDESSKPIKKRHLKKVLYLEIDDEITTIYDKFKHLKIKNIYLVVPKRAILFQSIVNLKILKRKAEDLGKNIFIITNDQNGTHLTRRVGLTVYDKLEDSEHPKLVSGKFWEDQQNITPLKASVNAVEEEMPIRQTQRKLSISEIVRRGKNLNFTSLSKSLKTKSKDTKKTTKENKLVLVAPNRQVLISVVVFSLVVLMAITYIALPGATIKLTPKSSILTTTSNIILADNKKYQDELELRPDKTIPSYLFTATVKKPLIYAATGEEVGEGTENATGTITIYNTTTRPWDLVANTRFQTQEGLVFTIQQDVTIPAQRGSTPGTLNAMVVANTYDVNNRVIGERGNIGPTQFFLPNLSSESQKKLYAKSEKAFTGGKTSLVKKISAQDLEAAKARLEEELSRAAQPALEQEIEKYNQEHNMNLVLLKHPDAIQKGEPNINIPSNLEGQKLESFEINGEMTVKGIAYDRNLLLGILRKTIMESPEKRLAYIDEKSLHYVLELGEDKDLSKVIITASVQAIEEYEIRPNEVNGERFIRKIKEHIVGDSIQEAKDYIENQKEIQKVVIEPWPIWSPTLPNIPDNIHIEIVRSEDN